MVCVKDFQYRNHGSTHYGALLNAGGRRRSRLPSTDHIVPKRMLLASLTSDSMTYGIPVTSEAFGVRETRSDLSICWVPNFLAPAISCWSPNCSLSQKVYMPRAPAGISE